MNIVAAARIAEPIILNVYDMNWINEYTTALGLGIFHSGVEVYGIEYSYGGHRFPYSGIFEIRPRDANALGENYRLRESIPIGNTNLTREGLRQLIQKMDTFFVGNRYHLLENNCNHFSNALTIALCDKEIPAWVNRLARIASHTPFLQQCCPSEWLSPLPIRVQRTRRRRHRSRQTHNANSNQTNTP